MVGSVEEGWSPPQVPSEPGGILAAPFDGSVRLAYVRYVAGPTVADDDETLVRALADREGLTSRVLRQEFARSEKSRRRLIDSLTNLAFFEAGESLRMTRLARIDGAPLAYATIRGSAKDVAEPRDLRAVPLGAWLRVAEALTNDTGEWVSQMYRLSGEVTELPIITCALHHAGLAVSSAQVREVEAVSLIAGKLPATRLRRTTAGNETIAPTMTLFDAERMLAVVLTQWLRADRQAFEVGVLDDELVELGEVPDVLQDLLRSGFPESLHLFKAPLLLAGSAAAVVLDWRLPMAVRSRLRRLLLAPRQQRSWMLFEPVASGLYLVALSKLWQDFRRACPTKEVARSTARTIEVEEVK